MNRITRARIARSLRGAAQVLNAGIVAYPTVMADAIEGEIKHKAASWFLAQAIMQKKKAEEDIAVTSGDAEAKIKLPMAKLPKAAAVFLADYLEERYDDPEWADWIYTDLTSKAAAKLTGLGVIDVDPVEVMKAGKHFYLNSGSTLADLSDDWLRLLSFFLYDAYDTFGASNNAAYKASQAIDDYLRAKKKLAVKKADGSMTPKFDEKRIESAKEALRVYDERIAFYRTMTKKPSKVIRHTFTIHFDPTGLPESYPIDRMNRFPIEVVFLISKKVKGWGGRWFDRAKKMEIILPNNNVILNDAQFNIRMNQMRLTIEHELAHMVQYLMQAKLKEKPEVAKRAGTPYSLSQPIPERTGNAAEKGAYPKATEKERYYLDPVEFFPQIISWTGWFIRDHVPARWVQTPGNPVVEKWKEYTGVAPTKTVAIGNFFSSLKKHDQRLWKRAVAEGWRIIKEKTAPPTAKLVRTTKEFDALPVGTKLANEAGTGVVTVTKTEEGWRMDNSGRARTAAELADAVRAGMRLAVVA